MLRGALRIAASTTASASAVSADAAAVMQPLKTNILELSKPELQSALSGMGLPAFKAKQARTGGRARAHGPRNRYALMLAHALRADRRHTRHACVWAHALAQLTQTRLVLEAPSGVSGARLTQVWHWLYHRGARSFGDMFIGKEVR